MARDLLKRYIWVVDTLRKHRHITRQMLSEQWKHSQYGNGQGMARRTFYNYRNAIEELFGIVIDCDPATYEYSLREDDTPGDRSLTSMMLSSAAMSNALTDMRDLRGRVFLEDVPSAHTHLETIVAAMKEMKGLRFSYSPFQRSRATGVRLEPYFLKIFRQRWYVTGRSVADDVVKTYALDRISDAEIDTGQSFEIPRGFDAESYVSDSFGIVFDSSRPREVQLRATSRQAKYLRALPLHHSQSEQIGDGFSIFTYRLRLTSDLVEEILRLGPSVTVEKPRELRAMVVDALTRTLDNYKQEFEDDKQILS
ncbi:MAG: WYL domain-containing protein [Muribaculaceae bacterium]|nr:WYL domain-containing protein [Muribaculaceae bacterium]